MAQPGDTERQVAEKGAVDKVMAGLTAVATTPAAPVTAPSAPVPAAPVAPATPTPAAPASGAAPVAPAVVAPEVDLVQKQLADKDNFIKKLQEENAQGREALQMAVLKAQEKQTEILQQLSKNLEAKAPEMTKEEREKKILSDFAKINEDPAKFIEEILAGREKGILKKLEALENKQTTLGETVKPLQPQIFFQQQVERLAKGGFAQEVQSPAFLTALRSAENVSKVYAYPEYAGRPAEECYNDPGFWKDCAWRAKVDAKESFAPELSQSEKDKASQAAIAAGQSALGTSPGGGGPAAAVKPKTDAQTFKDALGSGAGGNGGFGAAMDAAFKR